MKKLLNVFNIFNWLEDLIQDTNIMPIVALITIPHLYQVLDGHGEGWYVPAIISVFADILHYRVVLQASYTNKVKWWLFTLVTTSATFWLQYNFYGNEADIINRILFASIVPVGVVIMAKLESEKVLKRAEDIAKSMTKEIKDKARQELSKYTSNAMKAYEAKQQEIEGKRQVIARLTQENESILQRLESLAQELASIESNTKDKDSEITRLKGKLQDAKVIMKAYDNLNPLVQDIAKSKAGILQVTQAELASKHNTNETHVSRLAKHVNGVQS